jgi:hypothetical protein
MAKRELKVSIGGFWKKIQKNLPRILKNEDPQKVLASENELTEYLNKVNESYIPNSITQNFLDIYFEEGECSTIFLIPDDHDAEKKKTRPASFNPESSVLTIDIYAMYHYATEISGAAKALEIERESSSSEFKKIRQLSFMAEIAKFPIPYLFYLSVLQEVAYQKEIVSVEDKEGMLHKSNIGFYLTLLWALKEFEVFYLKTQNRNLRSDYGVIWHEGEWIEDDAHGRGYS